MPALDILYSSQLSSHIIHHSSTTLQSKVLQQTSDFMAGLNVTMHVEYDPGSRAVFLVHPESHISSANKAHTVVDEVMTTYGEVKSPWISR